MTALKVSTAHTDIRRLTPADAAAYRAIRLESLRSAPDSFPSSFRAENERPLSVFEKRLEETAVFAAEAGGAIIGMCGFAAQHGETQHHKGLVWGMYVTPASRGAGIGKRLLGAVIAHARGEVELLQLGVGAHNRTARSLCDSVGFREYGLERRALKVGEDYFDEALMSLRFR